MLSLHSQALCVHPAGRAALLLALPPAPLAAPPARTFLVMASAGGAGLTDRQQPVNTVTQAVRMTLRLAGTVRKIGAAAMAASARCDKGAGTPAGTVLELITVADQEPERLVGWLGGATAAAVPRLRQLLLLGSAFGAVARKEWQNALQLKENGPPAPAALGSRDVPSVELGAPPPPPQSCKHTSRWSKAPSKREITPPSSPALPRRPTAQGLRIPASP